MGLTHPVTVLVEQVLVILTLTTIMVRSSCLHFPQQILQQANENTPISQDFLF